MVAPRLHRTSVPILLFVVAGLAAQSASAQGLVTDRPDFTESAIVVPSGSVQLEAGVTIADLSRTSAHDETEWSFGEALLRWGVGRRLEARFQAPNYHRLSQEERTLDGFGDVSLGAKYQFGPLGSDGLTDIAVIGMFSLPTGGDGFGGDEVEPRLILTGSRSLGRTVSIGGQVFASLISADDDRAFLWGATVVGAVSAGPIGLFMEFAIDVPEQGTAPILAHAGIVLPVSHHLQLDLHGGFGVSDTSPDLFFGAGLAFGV